MKRRLRILRGMTVALPLLVLAVGIARHYQPPDPAVAFPAGAIVIGVDASFPPFAYDDGGQLRGLDIDLGLALAREIGLPARFVSISFNGLYDALISGKVDLLISALRVEPARREDVRYTQAYYDNGLVLVSARGAALNHGELAGRRIAFEYASSADSRIRAYERDGARIEKRPYELPAHALDALRFGQADGALTDATTFRLYARGQEEWQPETEYVTHDPYAIAVRIDRAEAGKLVDNALSALKDGAELARIKATWLGSDRAQYVGDRESQANTVQDD